MMMNRQTLAIALLMACACVSGAVAQTGRAAPEELRRQVERRFDVLVVRDGLALRPQSSIRGVRTIEVRGGEIVIDGAPATGAELRDRLGADADLVIQLSYLDVESQRKLFDQSGGGQTVTEPPAPPAPPDAAPPQPPEPPEPPEPTRARRSGDRVRIGGSITVDADELIDGDVVAIGGSARVFGEVRGEVVAIAGSVELGPNAVVRRDVTAVGGSIRRDPSARINGDVNEIGIGPIDLSGVRWTPPSLGAWWWGWTFGAAFALMATLIRLAVTCILAAIVILFGRDYIERVSARAAAEPIKAGAIGFLAQVLFLPVLVISIVLLVVTIIGIPLIVLIPFAVLGLGIVALVGFTAVGYHVGRLLIARLGWADPGPIGSTIAGIVLLVSPVLLARLIGLGGGVLYPMTLGLGMIGFLIEYLAWTVGFGAVALARFSRPTVPAGVQT
jgi:hypothetical protein